MTKYFRGSFDVTIRAHVVRECYRTGRLLELEQSVPELVSASEGASLDESSGT